MTTLEIILLIFCIAFFVLSLVFGIVVLVQIRKLRYARIAGELRFKERAHSIHTEDVCLRLKGGTVSLLDTPDNAPQEKIPARVAVANELAADAEDADEYPENAVAASETFVAAETAGEGKNEEENSVVISVSEQPKKTFQQKYDELLPDVRRRFDNVLGYILSKPDCRKMQSNTGLTVKCKTDKVMRVLIRRGSVLLHFMLANNELNRFVREEGVKTIKITPVVVRLDNEEDEDLAKQTADITLDEILAEQKYRKERLKEIRRERRRRKEREAAEAAKAASENTEE